MAAGLQDKVQVPCPHCGHRQAEPRTAISTVCKKCGGYINVEEILRPPKKATAKKIEQQRVTCSQCGTKLSVPPGAISTVCKKCGSHIDVEAALRPAKKAPEKKQDQKRVVCFECGTELEVAASAESTMCKRCSGYIDLRDYLITSAVSKNFKTRGRFLVEPKGYVFNTEVVAAEVVIKGRFHGKLTAERLTIHSGAEIVGSFKAARLLIPAANSFHWPKVSVTSAEIAGELVGNLTATGTVVLRSGARMFGNVTSPNLVVEAGAVVVGLARIGQVQDRLL